MDKHTRNVIDIVDTGQEAYTGIVVVIRVLTVKQLVLAHDYRVIYSYFVVTL